jgi:5-hydroxyisourate hydrolase
MSTITTHVLDTASGTPAEGLKITLSKRTDDGGFAELASGRTNSDGRIRDLMPEGVTTGVYQMLFDTGGYFQAQGVKGFYPMAAICFEIAADDEHYHIPLLLSPYGYSTYRGS